MSKPIIKVKNLVKYFPIKTGFFSKVNWVHAIDNVSFDIEEKITMGLVGESGCGKTTMGRCLLRLIEPTSGDIIFKEQSILDLDNRGLHETRRHMSIVFQDPFSSMNPRMLVKDIVGEPLVVHGIAKGKEMENIVLDLLSKVGLGAEHLRRFPHEFSGGQRQRITIARALSLRPELMVLDEPTSALDVSVQAKILNLLVDLQKEFGLTYLFISHNLDVIEYMSETVAVMYVGKIVEYGFSDDIYKSPMHPYTQALMDSIPVPDPNIKKSASTRGEVPSPIDPPSGCRFHPRCPKAMPKCSKKSPEHIEVGENHSVSCFLYTK